MEILALILGTYVITIAVTESEGVYGLLYKFRHIKAVQDFGVLECHLCTAAWTSAILCIIYGRLDLWLIAWGSSTLINIVVKAYQSKS